MSYGANLVDAYNQMGVQVGRLRKGASIADQPVVRPTKFELALPQKGLVSRSRRQCWPLLMRL
jgi:hypothetical protein